MQKNFWAHKKILVTGSSGFIGKHLVARLVREKANVLGLARHPKSPHEIQTELTNSKKLEKIFKNFKPSICFHLASEALVEQGQNAPYETFYNNVVSSMNILESCRLHNVSRVIMASTIHVYGKSPLPYFEQEAARPSRPYETSKTCTDLIAQSYADSFGVPVLIPRFVNIYGPGDTNFTRVIPKTIQSIIHNKCPTMWGGRAVREYLYIDDAIEAYIKLAQITDVQLEKNRIYNFGTGEHTSVESLMRKIIKLTQSRLTIKPVHDDRPEELTEQIASWKKAANVLGWKPQVKLQEGLVSTLAWYKEYFRLKDIK